MTLVLLQSLSLSGDPAKANEDAFANSDMAALVVDGATPLGEPLMPGPSDAAWLAGFGSRRLMAHFNDGDAPRDALHHTLTDAQKSFEALSRRAVREKWETPYASLMLAFFHPLQPSLAPEPATATSPVSALGAHGGGRPASALLEFLWFGDCSALLVQNGMCEIIGEAFERRGLEAYSARRLAEEKQLKPAPDLNRAAMLDSMRAGRNRINSGRNWLFSPDPRAAAHVAHQQMACAPGDLLLIASDGFLALATDYGAYDEMALVLAARDKGLAALGEELRAIENEDAMGEKFARFKKSDDATALLLEIT